jgi:hypothetical protein
MNRVCFNRVNTQLYELSQLAQRHKFEFWRCILDKYVTTPPFRRA